MSRVGVGIDFGTSNSVAAVYDGENLSESHTARKGAGYHALRYVSG